MKSVMDINMSLWWSWWREIDPYCARANGTRGIFGDFYRMALYDYVKHVIDRPARQTTFVLVTTIEKWRELTDADNSLMKPIWQSYRVGPILVHYQSYWQSLISIHSVSDSHYILCFLGLKTCTESMGVSPARYVYTNSITCYNSPDRWSIVYGVVCFL
jgi:uncharacterized protein Usg